MRKVLLSLLLMVLFSSVCYGASSEDMSVYVRQDVFVVEIKNINTKLDSILEELKSQRKDINSLTQSVAVLSARVDGVEKRMDTMNTFLYYLLVLFGAMILLPFMNRLWEVRKEVRAPSLTLDDVKRLIEENNARFNLRPQV